MDMMKSAPRNHQRVEVRASDRLRKAAISAVPIFLLTMLGLTRADAENLTVNDSAEGWVTSFTPFNNCCSANTNYLVGNAPEGRPGGGEFRNYFSFDIPSFSGALTSASIVIPTAQETFNQSPSLQYTLTSVAVPLSLTLSVPNQALFDSLGTGVVFGTQTYSESGPFNTVAISLDSEALAAITNSQNTAFTLGGRVTSSILFGPNQPDQLVFASSGGNIPQVQLVLQTSPSMHAAPEIDPTSSAAGLMMLFCALAVLRGSRVSKMST